MIDFYKLLQEHTLIFAIIFIIVFVFIRFYLWPKIRGPETIKVKDPWDMNQYKNTGSLK